MRKALHQSSGETISSFEEVERLCASAGRLWRLDGPVALNIPDLAPSTRSRFETSLSELADVCGCAEGSAAGVLALVAALLAWSAYDLSFSFGTVMWTIALVTGVTLFTKLLRVLVARMQLRAMLAQLLREAST